MPPSRPSIRSLARELGLAPSTVSDALRGEGRVAPATAARVREAADKVGYRPNPLTSSVLSEVRRMKVSGYRGTIATIDLHEPDHWPHGPFPGQIVVGARQRAMELGFSVEEFVVGPFHLSMARLNLVLISRGIRGVIVLPSWQRPDLRALDWTRFVGVHADYGITEPLLHSVSPDHFGSTLHTLRFLAERGYRRPGLVQERERDARLEFQRSGAMRAFALEAPETQEVPPLLTPQAVDFETEFAPWFRKYRPDVILSHHEEMVEWIARCSPKGEAPAGFVLLNALGRVTGCTALDLLPCQIGARAAELVIGQMLRGHSGPPQFPSRTTLPAHWIEGDSVRAAPEAPLPTVRTA